MKHILHAVAAAALALVSASASEAGPVIDLNYHDVLDLVHRQSSDLALAHSDLARSEAESELARAWGSGPSIEVMGGYRLDADEDRYDGEISIRQKLDLWRRERVDLATAGHEERRARIAALRASITATAIGLYYQALYELDRQEVLAEAVALHQRLNDVAHAREEAGEIGALDVQLTRVALMRSESAFARGQAKRQAIVDDLSTLLNIAPGTELTISGQLEWHWQRPVWRGDRHPQLSQLAAVRRRAHQAIAYAAAESRPELEVGLAYEREEGQDILRAGFGVAFGGPGRSSAASRAAQAAFTTAEIAYRRTALRLEQTYAGSLRRLDALSTALAAYDQGSGDAIGNATELAESSYAKGAVPLSDVLSLKRELLEARLEHLNLRLAVIRATIDTATAGGNEPFTGDAQSGAAATSSPNKETP